MFEKLKNKKGFSMVELIVVIAILAVIAVILVPTITKYVENSRAQKDISAMDEVVNAVQLSMSEQDCYDEMFRYSCTNNYVTYTDSSGNYGQQSNDEEYWAPDGAGRATTITFNPIKDEFGKTYYSLDRAIINDMTYGNGSVAQSRTMEGSLIDDNQCYLKNATTSEDDITAYVYNNVRKIAGNKINATSATYRNSSYTIFIKFDKNGDVFRTTTTGAFNGTNLHEGAKSSVGSHTSRYENDDPDKPIKEENGGTTTATFTNSDLMGSGTIYVGADYKTNDPDFVGGVTAILYSDGALVFQATTTANPRHGEVVEKYPSTEYDYLTASYNVYLNSLPPWHERRSEIESVVFDCEIKPQNTSYWFYQLEKCTSMNLKKLDTSDVKRMSSMFQGCKLLTELSLYKFDTSNVTYMNDMFNGCYELKELDVSRFNTSNVVNMYAMFANCKNLKTLDVSGFNTSKVTDMTAMFYNCNNLISLDISNFDTSKVTGMYAMFNCCYELKELDVANFNTSSVSNMSWMFNDCSKLTAIDVSNFDTSNVENFSRMFGGCIGLLSLDVSKFNTTKATNMSDMFTMCENVKELDVSRFNTSNVVNMYAMFASCKNIKTLDVSNFKTQNVTDMSLMFYDCFDLAELDVSSFETSKVESFYAMFGSCGKLQTLNVGNFDTSNAKYFSRMFAACADLIKIEGLGNFNTAKGINFGQMFAGCWKLEELDLSGFDTRSAKNDSKYKDEYFSIEITAMGEMFKNMTELERVILGEFFRFKGDGTTANPAVLPVPNPDPIPGANGSWYDASTGAAYSPDSVPDGSGVYVAVKPY